MKLTADEIVAEMKRRWNITFHYRLPRPRVLDEWFEELAQWIEEQNADPS